MRNLNSCKNSQYWRIICLILSMLGVPLGYCFRGWDQASHCRQGFILVLKWLVAEENSSTSMIIYLIIIQVSNDGKCRYNEATAASGRQIPPRQLDSLLHTGRTQTPVLLSGTSAPICVRTVKLKNSTVKSGKFIILLAFNNFLLKILFS